MTHEHSIYDTDKRLNHLGGSPSSIADENELICDDRLDFEELHDRIYNMTDEEFENYLNGIKEE